MRPFNDFATPRSSPEGSINASIPDEPALPAVDVRRFLRGTLAMGGGSAAVVGASIVKTKVVAVLLGPQGVGIIGMLGTLMSSFAAVAGFALIGTGVRQVAIARARDDDALLTSLNRALWLMPLALGCVTAALLFMFRGDIAQRAFGDVRYSAAVGWLAIGVIASALAESQLAWVNGFRKTFDVARITAVSSVTAALAACLAVLLLRADEAVLVVVIAAPLCSLAAAWWHARKLKTSGPGTSWDELAPLLRPLVILGFALMLRVFVETATQFATRWRIQQEYGLHAVGYFQAAWGISTLYLGFLYGSLWTNYFPKMSEARNERERLSPLLNEQTRVSLLLAGPIIFWLYAVAPRAVALLYTDAFTESSTVLRWLVLGDLFKVPTWTIGFLLMARNRGGLFLLKEASWNLLFFGILVWTLSSRGLEAAGMAYFVTHAVVLAACWIFIRSTTGFSLSAANKRVLLVLFGAAAALVVLNDLPSHGTLSFVVAIVVTAFCLNTLRQSMDASGEHRK